MKTKVLRPRYGNAPLGYAIVEDAALRYAVEIDGVKQIVTASPPGRALSRLEPTYSVTDGELPPAIDALLNPKGPEPVIETRVAEGPVPAALAAALSPEEWAALAARPDAAAALRSLLAPPAQPKGDEPAGGVIDPPA